MLPSIYFHADQSWRNKTLKLKKLHSEIESNVSIAYSPRAERSFDGISVVFNLLNLEIWRSHIWNTLENDRIQHV